jgi:hypothetical protein
MKSKILDPSRADGIPKSGLDVLDPLTFMGEHIGVT